MPRNVKKKVHKMPPLSFWDKCIYAFLLIVGVSISVMIFLIPIIFGDEIIFSDETVIAGENYFAWAFIPLFVVVVGCISFWSKYYQDRQPIFGLPNFKYGAAGYPKVYPLFMKNKPPVWMSEKKKKAQKKVAAILAVILFLSFIPYPFAFYGRECLCENGSIVQYNGFNRPVKDFSSREIDEVAFKVYQYSTGTARYFLTRTHYGIQVELTTDSGKKYTFEHHNFQNAENDEIPNWLIQMLQLKNCYVPEIITYDGLEYLDDVVSDNGLTEEETKMLYRLFGQM